jgi:hypothetical protein
MSDLSDYAEAQICKWAFTDAAITRPTAWYLALFTTAPTDAGGGVEVSGAGYARGVVSFAYVADGEARNVADPVEITATGGDFGSVVAVGIFDAVTGGNLWAHKTLSTPVTITNGQAFRVLEDALSIRIA